MAWREGSGCEDRGCGNCSAEILVWQALTGLQAGLNVRCGEWSVFAQHPGSASTADMSDLQRVPLLEYPTWKSAMAAPFSRAAYSSQGPIIQPKLVGQAATSPRRTSCCAQASTPHRIGVTCVHGIALGSPASQVLC